MEKLNTTKARMHQSKQM